MECRGSLATLEDNLRVPDTIGSIMASVRVAIDITTLHSSPVPSRGQRVQRNGTCGGWCKATLTMWLYANVVILKHDTLQLQQQHNMRPGTGSYAPPPAAR